MIASCSWDAPGADRYTGSVAAAIVAYGLPIDTQSALIAAFERREFTDTVVIDRDSIRGQRHDYSPDIRSMHFGGAGRICSSVTRAGWSAEHVETALVICAGDQCIAWPAVCGNVFRLTRSDPSAAQPVEFAESVRLPDAALAESDVQLLGLPSGSGDAVSPDSASIAATYFAPVFLAAPFITSQFFIAAPVPEPSTYLQLLAGIVAVVLWRKRS